MTRQQWASVGLLLALLGSALWLVNTSYEARRLYTAIERAQNEERRLDADFKRLDAERQAQATNIRVERVARERLRMRGALPEVTHYVHEPLVVGGAR